MMSHLKHGTVQIVDETVCLSAIMAKIREPALTKTPNWEQLRQTPIDAVPDLSASPAKPHGRDLQREQKAP